MNTKFGVWVLFPIYNSDFPAGFLQLYSGEAPALTLTLIQFKFKFKFH